MSPLCAGSVPISRSRPSLVPSPSVSVQTAPLIVAWANGEPWAKHHVVLTPHFAFWCDEAYRDMRHKAAATARAVLEGGAPRNCLNTEWLRVREPVGT